MNQNEVKHLNTALKGEYMAILGYDHFIKDIQDKAVKVKLQDIQKRHKGQATRIADKIQILDGQPINSAGLTGAVTEIKYKVYPKSHEVNDIIENAIDGEKMGLKALKEIINNLPDEFSDLIKQIQFENEIIIDDLNNLKQ